MKSHPIRHFFTNVICGLIPNKSRRKKVRVLLNSDFRTYVKFIGRDINAPIKKLHTKIGYGAQNLIIIVNDAYVYKFPLRKENPNVIALREKRIVDAFSKISPLPVPPVEILELNGIYIRKYPYIRGVTFDALGDADIDANIKTWAEQIAEFMYVISQSDPAAVRDLKPSDMRPGRMCGWCHVDLCGNFLIDPDTKNIVAIIDWEDFRFDDFSNIFHSSLRRGGEFLNLVRAAYLRLYNDGGK